jgi:cephalosporin hydroxylase
MNLRSIIRIPIKFIHISELKKHLSKQSHQACLKHGGLEFEVEGYTISDFILKKLIPIVGFHPYPLNELCLMVSSLCRLQPTHIFEWGTHVGKSARIFHESKKCFGINTEIHSIDLPDDVEHEEHPHKHRAHYVKHIEDVKLYQGDGVSTAMEICATIKGKINPLFYIDGDHEYTSVLRELKIIHENVDNANILLHDTFYQTSESGYNVGPFLAIQEFLNTFPNKYKRIDSQLGLPGMTLLYQDLRRGNSRE